MAKAFSSSWILIFLTFCLGCSPFKRPSQLDLTSGIVGGEPSEGSDPLVHSVVGLYLDHPTDTGPLEQICTGTLIAPNLVLTAAHCLDHSISDNPREYLVSFGPKVIKSTADLQKVSLRRGVAKVIHWKWIPPVVLDPQEPRYDLGILKFEDQAPKPFVPARFADSEMNLDRGRPLRVYGYGYVSHAQSLLPDQLMVAELPLDDWHFSPTHFVTLSGPPATCAGDSGGPAFLVTNSENALLVGVTSFGPSSCLAESYFVRVEDFAGWIHQTMQEPPISNP